MTAVPGATACTIPVESTAATAGFEVSQRMDLPDGPGASGWREPASSGGGVASESANPGRVPGGAGRDRATAGAAPAGAGATAGEAGPVPCAVGAGGGGDAPQPARARSSAVSRG